MCAKEVCVYCKSAEAIKRLTAQVAALGSSLQNTQANADELAKEIHTLTSERDRLIDQQKEDDAADCRTVAALQSAIRERDEARAEVVRLQEQVRFATETDPAMRAEAAEQRSCDLEAEVTRLKEALQTISVGIRDGQHCMLIARKALEAK